MFFDSKNAKTVLSLQAMQKQVASWIWCTGPWPIIR